MPDEELKNRRANVTRRSFLETAISAAAFSVVPASVLGAGKKKPPSEKMNIAGVGVAGRGGAVLSSCEIENIVALCDVDSEYAAGTFKKYPKAKTYTDFRRMLDEEDIDGVVVATPDHLHAVVSKTAMEAGKHVYCEKPLTHKISEARALRTAAHETGVVTQMGNHGHSTEAVRRLREWIQDGAIGAVREVHCWTTSPAGMWPQGIGRPRSKPSVPSHLDWDLWVGPAPKRHYHPIYHPNRWRGWWDFGMGALGDMGCHVLDGPHYALQLGPPATVKATSAYLDGRRGAYRGGSGFDVSIDINGEMFSTQSSCAGPDAETAPLASVIRYEFPARGDMPPVSLTWWDGGLKPPVPTEMGQRLPAHGNLFIGDKGKIVCGTYGRDKWLMPKTRRDEYEPPAKTLPRVGGNHPQNWIKACRGEAEACSNFDYAVPLVETVLLGTVALRTGKTIEWDPENMKARNAKEADRYIRHDYRKGWSL